MAITFSQEIFEKICSSATHSTAEVYDMIAPHLDDTLQSINCVLLGDMANKLDTVPGLEQAVTKLVCLRTYQEQIPQLDLVLTPTGFGVVSNQNLAPASADRVKNLLQQVTNAAEDTYDRCLELLVGTSWADTAQARINIPNLMYTAKQLKMYVDFPSARMSTSLKLLEFRTEMYRQRKDTAARVGRVLRPHPRTGPAQCVHQRRVCHGRLHVQIHRLLHRKELAASKEHAGTSSRTPGIRKVEVFTSYKDSEAYKVKRFQTL